MRIHRAKSTRAITARGEVGEQQLPVSRGYRRAIEAFWDAVTGDADVEAACYCGTPRRAHGHFRRWQLVQGQQRVAVLAAGLTGDRGWVPCVILPGYAGTVTE